MAKVKDASELHQLFFEILQGEAEVAGVDSRQAVIALMTLVCEVIDMAPMANVMALRNMIVEGLNLYIADRTASELLAKEPATGEA